MRRTMICRRAIGLLLLLIVFATAAMAGQGIEGRPVAGPSQPHTVKVVTPPLDAQAEKDRRRRREQKLSTDVERMVLLTTQLHEEMQQGSHSPPPADARLKVQEVERLARAVRKLLQD